MLDVKERREHERHPHNGWIQYSSDSKSNYQTAKISNYSAGGMMVESDKPVLTGTDIHIKVIDNPPEAFQNTPDKIHKAKVKWCTENSHKGDSGYSIGVQFDAPVMITDTSYVEASEDKVLVKGTTCPKCQFENAQGMKFCGECGCNLQDTKSSHYYAYSEPQSYTPKFLADKILQSKSSIVGERKLVTVLFADVANYTSMSEKLNPEQVHQIMDSAFKILMDEIHGHKGTINQFTGDGVMAIFGAPLAIEDHAYDACLAALAVQKSIKSHSKVIKTKYDFDFQMRIGINSGTVVVGAIGDDLRMDYTAVGDTTNLAARMESKAKPGTVLVSSNTYKKVSQQFEFKTLGKMEIKGKEKPLEVYELIKDRVNRPRLGQERQIYSEMVGRDIELNKLELQINKLIDGDGSVINIIGEAGIGKSRLIAELKRRDVMKRVTFLEGRAISIGENLSFHPIINLLKHWAGIKEEDDSSAAISKLEKAIINVCKEDSDEIFPFVATLMGIKLFGRHAERIQGIEGESLEKLIFKNIRDLLIKSTEISPLVIMIEDLHWSDLSTIELLESLFHLTENERILFINVFRPNHLKTGNRIINTINEKLNVYYVEINVRPLDDRMGESLINNILKIKGLQHSVVRQVVQRSGGNPFFIEEVVRSFLDEGAVIKANGEFKVTDKIESVFIPQTINDVLMARIDRLDDETKNLVKVASVIGRNFFYRILSEVGKKINDIDKRISYLKEIQFIRERNRMDELEYIFKHALAQEAAYESILQQRRKSLHLQVAQSIEKVFNERLRDFYGMLALHYIKCERYENAENYLVKAGAEALKASASSEALNYYKEGLKLYLQSNKDGVDHEKLAMFQKNIGIALFNKGKHEEALLYIDKVLAHYGADSPINDIVRIPWGLWNMAIVILNLYLPLFKAKELPSAHQREIFRLWEIKEIMLVQLDPINSFIEQFYMVRTLYRFNMKNVKEGLFFKVICAGQFAYTNISYYLSRKFLNSAQELMDLNEPREKMPYETMSLVNKWCSGEWQKLNYYDESIINQNLESGELWYPTLFVWCYGHVKVETGEFDEVQIMSQKLNFIWNSFNYEIAKIFFYQLEVDLLLKRRQYAEAEELANEGAKYSGGIGQDHHQYYLLGDKIIAQIYQTNIDGALDTLNIANGIIAKQKHPLPCYLVSVFIGRLLIDIFCLKQAIALKDKRKVKLYKRKGFKTFKACRKKLKKYPKGKTELYNFFGQYFWLINKKHAAFHYWNKSVKEGKRYGAKVELARTYLKIYRHSSELKKNKKKKYDAHIGLLNEAKNIFKDLNLQHDLDEMEKNRMGYDSEAINV